jgi:adenylate cyclase
MDLPAPLAWLVDEAGASSGPDRFLAELGGRLLADRLPLAGGALTLAVPHPIIARRTWLWRAETGTVIEALGFTAGAPSRAGRDWLAGPGAGAHGWPGAGRCSAGLGRNPAIRLRRGRTPARGRALRRGPVGGARRAGGAGGAARGLSRPAQCRARAGRRAAPRHRGRPSAPRCSLPICAASPPCPRRPSPWR